MPASPPPPSGSCFSSPKANCYTSYGCGRGPDTLTDKGRWSGGDDITRKSPRKSPAAPPQAHRGDRQTDRQTDTPQHPLGASRRPKNHAGFHCTHAPTSERQYFSPRCHPLGPKNLRTGNGKLARPQRRLCQTICKIYPARTLVALLWVVAHRHHPRLVGGGGAQWDSLTAILQYDRSCCLTDLELSVA